MIIIVLGTLISRVYAASVGVSTVDVSAVQADFGIGTHIGGTVGPATITWDYTPVNGVITVTARLKGTLFIDRLGPGCGRLQIDFQDIDGNNLTNTRFIDLCGPGFDANSPSNQREVDVRFGPNTRLRFVNVVISAGPTLNELENDNGLRSSYIDVNGSTIINNGFADFGNLTHVGGTPLNPANVRLHLTPEGVIQGSVKGILFWDSFNAGCSRLIIDFRDIHGAILRRRTINECGPIGGNALLSSNQTAVNRSFTSPLLFSIRLRVGQVKNGSFVGPVTTRTFSFGQ
jgi:hypothetical protein